MAKWSVDPDAFFRDVELTANQKFRSFGLEALSRVVLETPIVTGRLRGAWMITLDTPSEQNPTTVQSMQFALDAGTLSIAEADLTNAIIVQNNVEYGPYVNDGTEKQAGQFFVERAINSLVG